jgi:hypothetical protein
MDLIEKMDKFYFAHTKAIEETKNHLKNMYHSLQSITLEIEQMTKQITNNINAIYNTDLNHNMASREAPVVAMLNYGLNPSAETLCDYLMNYKTAKQKLVNNDNEEDQILQTYVDAESNFENIKKILLTCSTQLRNQSLVIEIAVPIQKEFDCIDIDCLPFTLKMEPEPNMSALSRTSSLTKIQSLKHLSLPQVYEPSFSLISGQIICYQDLPTTNKQAIINLYSIHHNKNLKKTITAAGSWSVALVTNVYHEKYVVSIQKDGYSIVMLYGYPDRLLAYYEYPDTSLKLFKLLKGNSLLATNNNHNIIYLYSTDVAYKVVDGIIVSSAIKKFELIAENVFAVLDDRKLHILKIQPFDKITVPDSDKDLALDFLMISKDIIVIWTQDALYFCLWQNMKVIRKIVVDWEGIPKYRYQRDCRLQKYNYSTLIVDAGTKTWFSDLKPILTIDRADQQSQSKESYMILLKMKFPDVQSKAYGKVQSKLLTVEEDGLILMEYHDLTDSQKKFLFCAPLHKV